MININIEDKAAEIIRLYTEEDLNTVEIANIIGCADGSIGRLLNRHNVPRVDKHRRKLSDADVDSICQEYINGETTVSLGKKYNVSDRIIAKYLRSRSVEVRPAKRRSVVGDHRYFQNIDSVDKAYFLGWIISDGSIIEAKTRPGRAKVISLEINTSDRYILEMFADAIKAPRSIVKDNAMRGHSYIRFASTDMAKDLEKYGVVPRKSFITYLPDVRNDLMPHLIRGFFDGNGTVTIDKRNTTRFAFYGSKTICEDIRDYLHENIGINKNKVSKSTCYHVWWGGNTPSALMCKFLYADCGKYYLTRKREKFEKCI